MEVRIEKRFDTPEELVLDIEVKRQSIDEFIEQAYLAIAAQRGVQQLAGETPKQACEKALTQKVATELASNAVMNMSYPFARSQAEDVVTVGDPLFTFKGDLKAGEPFHYTARWAKLPQAELTSYEPITFHAPARTATDEMVDEQIHQIIEANARYERGSEQRPVEPGDVVSLALRTTLDGNEIEGLCFDERTYTTGAGNMPDEFEDNIVGMEPGQEKDFSFQGIADVDENEQPIMKTYEAHVQLFALLERVVPQLTDAWVAASIPGCNTVSDLRSMVRTQLDQQLEGEYRHYLNYIAASKLAERFEGSIPDAAYEAMHDEIQAQFDREAASMGLTREEYMRQQGVDDQQYSVRMILQVRERLVQTIALDAFARHEGVEVTEEDLEEFFTVSAPAGGAAELRRQLQASGRMYLALEGARRLKANDLLVSRATILE